MAAFKLTISDKKGASSTREIKDAEANQLIGASIGSELDAAVAGLSGKLTITGGSDKSGVPMRADVHGGARKYVMLSRGVGLPHAPRGRRVRKLIRGNEVTEELFQINCRYDGVLKADKPEPEEGAGASGDGSASKGSAGAEAAPGDAAKPEPAAK